MSGCVTFNDIETSVGLEQMRPDEGVVVIGAPSGTRIVIHSGSMSDGEFAVDGWLPEGVFGSSENGFLVRRLRAQPSGKAYGLVSVLTDTMYSAECGTSLVTFNVTPGEVQYVTTFSFKQGERTVLVDHSTDLPAASAYIRSRFPEYNKNVTQALVVEARQRPCVTPPIASPAGP